MTILDVCAYLGLAAVGTATVNMLLGLLIALRYSPVRLWPHRRMNIFRLHNLTACLVLLLIVLHPAVLLLKSSTHFGWGDVLLPIHSPVQPRLNTVGAVSLYVLLVVIFTSLLRRHIARPLWRKLHYLVFPAFALMFFHSVLTDPTLSKRES
jgi:predicted ferric reductase